METQLKFMAPKGFFDNIDSSKYYLVEYTDILTAYITLEISQEEYKHIVDANEAIFSYMYFKRKRKEIELNQNDFLNAIVFHNSTVENKQPRIQSSTKDSEEMFVNINRTFTNYINSCRIFIDHMDGRIKHKYSEVSNEYQFFKKVKNYCYDTYFSYRFFYHLRNYIEHTDFPIHDVISEGNLDENNLSQFNTNLALYFNRDMLLTCKTLSKKMGDELSKMEERIPVMSLLPEFTSAIEHILDSLLFIERDYYVSHSNTLIDMYNKGTKSNNVTVMNITENDDKGLDFKYIGLNINLVNQIAVDLVEIEKRQF
jgi:hypothetical protein